MAKKVLKDEFKFKDPYKGNELVLKIIPVENLEVISHQRKPSNYHVNHIMTSIKRIGYLVPVIVVEKGENNYLIIDGQHRFLAAKELGIEKLPCIVVPKYFENLMMNFNIEKELNIREKAYVAHALYNEFLQSRPDMNESSPEMIDSIEKIYYVTLGFAYNKEEKVTGSAFESILKKCDFPVDMELQKAVEVRKERAEKILTANEYVRRIGEKIRETGKWHPYMYHQILSWANPYKRKRLPVDFNELFDELIANLKEGEERPEEIIAEVEEEEV